jgi:2,3,4,5-tetrahydropyridine-2-carboxylate N-succinyltransferase
LLLLAVFAEVVMAFDRVLKTRKSEPGLA